MKKKRAIIVSILGAVVLLAVIFFCWKNRYGAKLYNGDVNTYHGVREEFIDQNRVYGAYYFNSECLEDSDESTEISYRDNEAPETRTFLIKDEETFKEIFYEDALDVNFEEEMLVLHIFCVHHVRDYYLKNVTVKGDTLKIEIGVQIGFIANAAIRGSWKYVVVKMKKLDIDEAVVIQ